MISRACMKEFKWGARAHNTDHRQRLSCLYPDEECIFASKHFQLGFLSTTESREKKNQARWNMKPEMESRDQGLCIQLSLEKQWMASNEHRRSLPMSIWNRTMCYYRMPS
ncbi:hypothetical protein NDU88_001160 [Pleurodeles waltl]|uniref:Uncharacterized protein n=1 Tax=Pleurodeles waltl TaxID=8319 RepID=A0AAV7L8R5_PLEWA|nr:hypothetical protein NDU88_001160 [Pleurodeles waltl]